MKRSTAIISLAAMIAITQSGCMCVHAVKTGGTHIRCLQPTGVWTNSAAEVMAECSALDKRVLSNKTQNLGKRLVCASPSAWNSAIKAEFEKQRKNAERYGRTNKIDHVFLRPAVTLSVTNAANMFAGNHLNMNDRQNSTAFDWGAFFFNTAPFFLAGVIGLGMFRSNPGALLLGLASPLLMLATLIPIAFCFRPGLGVHQRIITFMLDLIAFIFFGVVSWGFFMLWRMGPLRH